MSHISQLRDNLRQIAEFSAFPHAAEAGGAAAAIASERPIHAAAEVFSRYAAQTGHPLPGTGSKSDFPSSLKDIVWSYLPPEEQERVLSIQERRGIQAHAASARANFIEATHLQISSPDPRSWQPIASLLTPRTTFQDVLKRIQHSSNQIRLEISNLDDAQLGEVFAFLEEHHLLENVYHFSLRDCPQLRSIPHFRFPHLRSLQVNTCFALQTLPSLDQLTQLQTLDITGSVLQALPSLDQITQLQTLQVKGCPPLQALPNLDRLSQLHTLDVVSCGALQTLPSLGQLTQLQTLRVEWCPALRVLPSLDRLTQLQTLYIGLCHALQDLPNLDRLSQLHNLRVIYCGTLRALPSLDQLTQLRTLDIDYCNALRALPNLDQLVELHTLHVRRCRALRALPNLDRLNALEILNIGSCPQLPTLNSIEDYRRYLQKQHYENLPWSQRFFRFLGESVTSVWEFFTGLGRSLLSWLRSSSGGG